MAAVRTMRGAAIDVRSRRKALRARGFELRNYMVYVAFLLVFGAFAIILRNQGFLAQANLLSIVRVNATTVIMAVGSVFVLSAGEIDLSIGSVVAMSAVATGLVINDYGPVVGVLAGLGVGLGTGLANGLLTTKIRIPSFLVTLGMSQVLSGVARSSSNLEALPVNSTSFQRIFGQGDVGSFPGIFIWAAVVVFVGHILYRKTPFGRHVLATGGNRTAARYSGINTDRVKIVVLALSGLTAGLAGVLDTGRLGGARYDFGTSDLLAVLAAVVIGGTSLFGGRGSVIGALFGALLIGALTNGLILLNISVSNQMVAQGAIIILAVSLSLRERDETGQRTLVQRFRRSLARYRPAGDMSSPDHVSPQQPEPKGVEP